MFFIAYAFKGQVHVFAGRVKIAGHSSSRISAILKYFCPLPVYNKTNKMNSTTSERSEQPEHKLS